MRVISLRTLRAFWDVHPDAEGSLRHRHKIALHAQWQNLQDVRRTFPHADGVRNAAGETLTIFNISGNEFRLIVRIRYDFQLINIRFVLTHAEYSRGKWKEW